MVRADDKAAGDLPRRLFAYSAGFFTQPRLRRILALAGHKVHFGLPGPQDGVVVWGRSPTAPRGEAIAARRHVPLIRVEDAFLRSLRPGRMGDPPMGLMIDPQGVHFDSSTPSALEQILSRHPLDDSNLLTRSRDANARIFALDLSKYNIHDSNLPPPPPGYVLVIDQTKGDASIARSGASAARFTEMLALARSEHPAARIVIKTHPETQSGLRPGHFTRNAQGQITGPTGGQSNDAQSRITLCDQPVSPRRLLEGAVAVYTVSSHLGFEAILAGHRPTVLGQPFYAGWGLTDDRFPVPRRTRTLTRSQIFAAAMILAPTWIDPCRDRLCEIEQVIDHLEAQVRAFREDRHGHVAAGMRLWKRRRLQEIFGHPKPLIFCESPTKAAALAQSGGRSLLIWATKAPANLPGLRVEDGFLRSRGLGANLIPPLSLITDDLGIYYDPSRPSRLETLILSPLPPAALTRARHLRQSLIDARVSKYNLHGTLPDLPQGHRILVPGQVEDDASIRLGTTTVQTNLALLQATRAANPGAILIYKPHPDVEAGLRPGAVAPDALRTLADVVANSADPLALIDACAEVWTMTSLLGFEALIRGKHVTCLGAPFYAGWGLTRDRGPTPKRRSHAADGHPLPRPSLDALIHAALIAYPRYHDPVTKGPCPAEVAVERLAAGPLPSPGLPLRLLAKLQGVMASQSHLWR